MKTLVEHYSGVAAPGEVDPALAQRLAGGREVRAYKVDGTWYAADVEPKRAAAPVFAEVRLEEEEEEEETTAKEELARCIDILVTQWDSYPEASAPAKALWKALELVRGSK